MEEVNYNLEDAPLCDIDTITKECLKSLDEQRGYVIEHMKELREQFVKLTETWSIENGDYRDFSKSLIFYKLLHQELERVWNNIHEWYKENDKHPLETLVKLHQSCYVSHYCIDLDRNETPKKMLRKIQEKQVDQTMDRILRSILDTMFYRFKSQPDSEFVIDILKLDKRQPQYHYID